MDLLQEIVRCPNVQACLSNSAQKHPCSQIVNLQRSKSLDAYQVPEPWSGHLDKAPILFVSSNPSISDKEEYPRGSWGDSKVQDYFVDRFDGYWIKDGIHGRQLDGSYARATRFWVAVRKHASDLLQREIREIRPGIDYALTEVIHCKSLNEEGVKEASQTCGNLYLRRILEKSGARVIVFLGSTIRDTVKQMLKIPGDTVSYCQIMIGLVERQIAFLPHPNARGYRSFARCMPDDLQKLRSALIKLNPR